MLTRRRNTKARTEDTGEKLAVSKLGCTRPLALFCGGLAVLTIFSGPDWIEALTGYDPDQNDGDGRVARRNNPLVNCAVLALAARAEWRRSQPAIVKS